VDSHNGFLGIVEEDGSFKASTLAGERTAELFQFEEPITDSSGVHRINEADYDRLGIAELAGFAATLAKATSFHHVRKRLMRCEDPVHFQWGVPDSFAHPFGEYRIFGLLLPEDEANPTLRFLVRHA
jgi:hypothetical protein